MNDNNTENRMLRLAEELRTLTMGDRKSVV